MSSPPTSKLKQSSLSSFLCTTLPLEYEQEREENIRRNQEFLRSLGITTSTTPTVPKKQARGSKPKNNADSPLPPRRSTRKRTHSSLSQDEETTDVSSVQTHYVESPLVAYVDSSVVQYTCDHSSKDPPSLPISGPISGFISGFRVSGKTMRDPGLTKIYSMDVSFLSESRFLVAAGGHGGVISILGGDNGSSDSGDVDEEEYMEVGAPVMSWRGSNSWVSGVRFVDDNPMMLVSTSNDGKLIVWDTSKKSKSKSPLVVAESKGLHSGGIFCMDKSGHTIATASKDSSVGIWRMSSGEVVAECTVSGHHKGVVRGVCFGGAAHRLADCGADGSICVLDTRVPEACRLTVKSWHSGGANSIEWCPSNEFLLVSAGKDPRLVLYDIRNSSDPVVHVMEGHADLKSGAGNQKIYKPAFVDNGMGIATSGQGSNKISLYSVGTGKLLSQGWIGYDANMVFFTARGAGLDQQHRLWAAGKQINQLCPL